MTPALFADLAVFVLALLVGIEVISKVPATLHTPLMSAANAIHGIVVVGAMIVAAATDTVCGYILAFVAAVFAAMNVVGGYVVTDRMLGMFKQRPVVKPAVAPGAAAANAAVTASDSAEVSA